MNGTIHTDGRREGIVVSLTPDYVTVRILQQSACAGCHARSWCVSSECAERDLRLKTDGRSFALGQHVTVTAEERVGRLAILLAFILPLMLLVGTLVALTALLPQAGEGLQVVSVLALLALYYLVLYAFREHLGKRLHLEVLPLSPAHD